MVHEFSAHHVCRRWPHRALQAHAVEIGVKLLPDLKPISANTPWIRAQFVTWPRDTLDSCNKWLSPIYLRQYVEDTVIAFILMATHGLGIPWTHASTTVACIHHARAFSGEMEQPHTICYPSQGMTAAMQGPPQKPLSRCLAIIAEYLPWALPAGLAVQRTWWS